MFGNFPSNTDHTERNRLRLVSEKGIAALYDFFHFPMLQEYYLEFLMGTPLTSEEVLQALGCLALDQEHLIWSYATWSTDRR